MNEKKLYVAPTIESVDISATAEGPCGAVPDPTQCGPVASSMTPDPGDDSMKFS